MTASSELIPPDCVPAMVNNRLRHTYVHKLHNICIWNTVYLLTLLWSNTLSDFSYSNGCILVFLFDFFMFFVLAPNFYQILFSFLIVHITILEVLKKSYLFLKVCHLSNSCYKRNIFPSASINEIRMNYQKIKVYITNFFLKTLFFILFQIFRSCFNIVFTRKVESLIVNTNVNWQKVFLFETVYRKLYPFLLCILLALLLLGMFFFLLKFATKIPFKKTV